MEQKKYNSANTFSLLAFICGILGLVTACCIYSAVVFGALAILFALLSRGRGTMSGRSKIGLGLGFAAMIVSVVVTVGSFAMALKQYGSMGNLVKSYITTLEESGIDPEVLGLTPDALKSIGIDIDE